MKTNGTLAITAACVSLAIGTSPFAAAGDQYAFPSAGGAQLGAMPAPVFVPPTFAGQGWAGARLDYRPVTSGRHEPPAPPPAYAFRPHLMSHALMVAPYANYAADYSRLFAPNFAVTAWTDRVFGVMTAGYGAVDGWTAAAYGLPRVAGPRRRGETAPDLSPMPALRAHPELNESPVFDRRSD